MVAPLAALAVSAATPFVKSLIENGIGLLGGVIQKKGKEYVEEKLNVKLPDQSKPATPEQLEAMRRLEFEHEELLLRHAKEMAELELKGFQTEVEDKKSARLRDELFLRMGKHNWRADFMFLLAIIVVTWLVYIVWKDPAINEYVKGIFTLVLGRFLGYLDNIYNFEFGTTRNSRTKDTTIEQLSKGK